MKRGIAQLALPPPKIAVAGEQPVSKQLRIGPRGYAFDEVARFPQQDLLDVLRVKEHVNVEIEKAVVDNVAVVSRPAHEGLRGIAAGHERGAHDREPAGARRPDLRWCGGGGHGEELLRNKGRLLIIRDSQGVDVGADSEGRCVRRLIQRRGASGTRPCFRLRGAGCAGS